MRPQVITLMGPTAGGKTPLAAALAERLPLTVISVDSAQVYRGMDIGTAKPDAALLAKVPHRLLDIADPAEAYSAARFAADATCEIEAAHAEGKIPLLVGGTMLYFRALLEGLSALPAADEGVRAEISAEAAERGWPALHVELAKVDPVTAARLHPNDAQRIHRALEVFRLTGQALSQLQSARALPKPRWDVLRLAIQPKERATLHQRIEARFEAMMALGFLDEVRGLRARADLHPDLPSIRAVGYRQLWAHLGGELSLEQAVQAGIAATRQLARRQLTWLRAEPALHWLDGDGAPPLEAAMKMIDCMLG